MKVSARKSRDAPLLLGRGARDHRGDPPVQLPHGRREQPGGPLRSHRGGDLGAKSYREFEGCSAVATPDGGFVVFTLAYINSNLRPRTRLVKLDGNSKVVWDWKGRGNGGRDTPFATSLKLTASGSVERIGHVYASNSPEGGQRVWRAEVDASGKLLRDEVGEPLPPHGNPRTK